MIVYFAFLIPVIFAVFLYLFFRKQTLWWEVLIPMVATVIFVLIAKWISVSSLTQDTEWLGGYVEKVQYYEPWDEEVTCRHPIYCSREECSGSGSSRSCHTVTYECGKQHLYDVDYHSENWVARTTLDDFGITRYKYDQLVAQFGTGKQFVDLNRDYHSIDGDMYSTKWGGEDETLEPVAKSETYQNRPKASQTIYHYQELDSFDISTYKPFDYPPVIDNKQVTLLGYDDELAHHKIQVINAEFGALKQVRVFLLVFTNQPREAGEIQERYWQGGNKNEIVVCVGINNNKKIIWGHVFSWTEQTEVKIKIRKEIENEVTLNLNNIISTIQNEVKLDWKRKRFREFDYINIEPTMNQIIWIYVLTLIINIGIAWWIIANEFNDKKRKYHHRRW